MPDPSIYPINPVQPQEDEISLVDLAITLAKNKKTILVVPIISGMVALVICFFIPNVYTADTQILPPQQQSSASAMLSQLGSLGGLAGISSGMGIKNPNDTYVAMLKSRTLQDKLIKRFKLQIVYDKKSFEKSRLALREATTVKVGKDGIIGLSVEDHDPRRASLLANAYVDELQQMTQVFAVTEASQRRLFFEKQLLLAKQSLGDSEIAMKQLQEKTGIIQLDAQAKLVIGTAAQLKAQIAMKEVELGAQRTFSTGDNPDYIRSQQILAGLRSQLAKVETGRVTSGKVPEAGLEYMRRVRDLKYAETVYELLAKQFEVAKIDEAKQSSVIQVLDRALVPEKKSKPQRSMIVLLSSIVGGFLAILWVFISEALQNAKKDEESGAQLKLLRDYLRWK
ncbi:MAG: Wzz/FepE/Etk N-terminal domain-containing protein [Chlorobium sp.]